MGMSENPALFNLRWWNNSLSFYLEHKSTFNLLVWPGEVDSFRDSPSVFIIIMALTPWTVVLSVSKYIQQIYTHKIQINDQRINGLIVRWSLIRTPFITWPLSPSTLIGGHDGILGPLILVSSQIFYSVAFRIFDYSLFPSICAFGKWP